MSDDLPRDEHDVEPSMWVQICLPATVVLLLVVAPFGLLVLATMLAR